MKWAAGVGIVEGYAHDIFAPDDIITREQIMSILWRYCRYKESDVSADATADLLSFSDASTVSEWALPAMRWARSIGIIEGIAADILDPWGSATRAQAAVILYRFCEDLMPI